ncbi:GDP-Man:Man(3)GlcNAc(2)-PP-Dol alpha-1,2-mannosyltransferase-like isoform X1 [Mizuhopecten yessoensis]|uniref:GDP-Man:Man(3)GlcNAc(2)-PP-Dol alpha-1,2-mannosyltransferase-like isoform X1 n=1 Tax=Mizuhopecten yessoensis TaxID=6573 RepID=UPI000B45A14E|nr:GDP-Man:Man(3)GlcNAc(2)-PP-Dol alpha-1,2-mannosyltransferase-like isoform X1 [Mizuhopecten yessoensis]
MEVMKQFAGLIQQYLSFLSEMLTSLICICVIFIIVVAIATTFLRYWIQRRSAFQLPHIRKTKAGEVTPVIGFFHPYCNAGGGGERVLWVAIRSIQKRYPNVNCVVYTGDTDATGPQILERARQRFNITLKSHVQFVFLKRRRWVEAVKYPMFTLLGQSLGSILLGWEALQAFVPDVYIDTMGYAFTIPLFKYFGRCKVCCYVHYPTISTDMLEKVSSRTEAFNNASFISQSRLLSTVKLQYYKAFAYLYGVAGKRCHAVMVNSTWTYGHIQQLWQPSGHTHILFPPCDTSEFTKIYLREQIDSPTMNIVSIAQFRPEKDHALQIDSFHHFMLKKSEKERSKYKLVLVGSCRNGGDNELVEGLKQQCDTLGIAEYVEFKLNVSFQELKELMATSVVGLHTMWNEHFGIGVVELMAAGTVVLAHNSGGPKLDIVVNYNDQATGFLAEDVQSYSHALDTIFSLTARERLDIRKNARESISRFSEEEFEHGFLEVIEPLITNIQMRRTS